MKKLYLLLFATFLYGISYGQNDIPELLYYKFDDGSTIVNDADAPVGTNPASITGSGLTVGGAGLHATALQGTGVSSTSGVINTGWNTNLSGSFTIGFWTSDIAPSGTLYYIFGDNGAGGFRCFTNGAAGSNNWMIRGGNLPDLTLTGAATMTPNYIHAVYDAVAGTYTGYIDGVQNVTVTAPTSNTMSGTGFQIGGYGSNNNLNGLMDEFRIYNRALNQAEIQATINGTIIGEHPDCFSPGDLALDVLLPTTAEFSWTASPDETGGYDWALMNPGDDPDVDTPIQSGNVTGTSLLISNLTVLTDYVFFIQTDCGADGPSVWRSVEFQTPPTCPGVDNIQVYNMTHQQAEVSWDEMGPATSWNIEYGAPGYTPGTGTSVSTTSNPHTLTGLSMFTEYDLYVQSDCGPGDLSVWFGPFNFHTTIDCTAYALDITSTTDNSVCGGGSVTLEASASGTGTDILWYDSLTSTIPLGSGTEFQTPSISSTTSYWVAEAVTIGGSLSGQGKLQPTQASPGGYTLAAGLEFTVTSSFTLMDITAYSYSTSGGVIPEIQLQDSNGNMLQQVTNIPVPPGGTGTSMVPFVIPLNFNIAPGDYRLMTDSSHASLARDSGASNGAYPHPIGTVGTITGGILTASTSASYYYFYNWTISTMEVECESPREEVIATVNNQADEDVLTLPYTHTANTFDYDNNYSGAPGSDCGSTDHYLDGYDVVYKYTADDDYILNIELSGLTEPNTAVFIYESCADIGSTCYAEGSVNENIGTHSFQVAVEDTKDYYIVVSSADPTTSFNYTLTIDGTTCANYPAPTGPTAQNFIDGQTIVDLDVAGSELTWYSDAALTITIPDTTLLVDATTYYVTQSFQGCEGAALAITATEVACTTLEVLNTTPGAVCGEGSVILEAQGAGMSVHNDIFWYDVASGGSVIGKGNTFRTPELQQTTSFWASEVSITGESFPGQGETNPPALTNTTSSNAGLLFEVIQDFTLESVTVLNTAAAGGQIQVDIRDVNDNNNVVFTTTVPMPGGGTTSAPVPVVIPIDHDLPVGNYRILRVTSGSTVGLGYMSAANSNFPYNLANNLGTITSGSLLSSTSTLHYYFFDWTIASQDILCASPREEVVATVNNVADELVAEPLPFTHTANTAAYGNNYEGQPGGDCNDGTAYLDGNDVVYQYSPSVGAVYSIELSGLSSNNAAVFVYRSCYDIGNMCYAGAVNDGTTGNITIEEVPMFDGFDYFIVISTSDSPSTDYTLTIDLANINCSDYTAAPDGDANQFFEAGDTLEDLVVHGGNLTWYSDAAGTLPIPNTTLLVDGDTYYVKQTLNGCDSDLLAITVTKIDCSALEIVSTTDGTIVCKGVAHLQAVGNGGIGTEIYWYDAATGGNRVGMGPTFVTDELTSTTSYWASEVFIEGDAQMTGQGYVYPSVISSGSNNNQGIMFTLTESIELVDVEVFSTGVGGAITIELRDVNNGNQTIATANATVPGGGSTANPVPMTVPLNFSIPPGEYRLLKTSATGPPMAYTLASNTSYPYPIGNSGEITSGATATGTATTYYYFFNWTIGSGQVLCESPREEVVATVTQDGDVLIPSGSLPYVDANNSTANYGSPFSGEPGGCGITDNYLNGHNAVYMYTATADDLVDITLKDITGYYAGVFVYESCGDIGTNCVGGAVAGPSDDDIAIKEFPFVTGETYYIVVSSWLTPTIDYTLEIKGFDCATFPAPVGDANQDFAAPAYVSDLEVEGTMSVSVLNWYEDAAGTISITDPTTTPLVNGDTYYVSQTYGTCESPLLAITVTEIDCSDLEIISSTGATVTCKGSVTLTATASGHGSEIYWYDDAIGGDMIGMGSVYVTDELTLTTSYWVSEVLIEGEAPLSGQGKLSPTAASPGGYTLTAGLEFTATDSFTLVDVEAFSYSTNGGTISSIQLQDHNGNMIDEILNISVPPGGTGANMVAFTIPLNFSIPGPGTYRLMVDGNTPSLARDSGATNAAFPHNIGTVGTITGGILTASSATSYYYFYNWTIGSGIMVCESPREEVIATVDQAGDKLVGPLDYTDTDNTANYGGSFSGSPGCDINGNYLDGNAVVYRYSPAVDDIVNIELTNVTNNSTGVFVYQSCGDVGTNCLAGATSVGGVYLIEDFYATGGQDYFIVISSETGSTNYTLNIYGFDCNNAATPSGDATQYFVGTKYLTDLDIDEHPHSTGLNWYEDAAGTQPINDPTTWQLVDNTTYYVSQTVLGCESDLFAVTALEFACSDLEIVSTTGGIVCQSGRVTLTAQGSGIGNEIYWYPSPTSTQRLGIGNTYETDILFSTRSYWAEEVYVEGMTPMVGQGKPTPTGTSAFASTLNYGLQFNVAQQFTLMSVDIYPTAAGNVEISLNDSSGNTLNSVNMSVSSGGPVTVPLNFDIPPGNGYRLLQTSNPSIALIRDSSGNSFPYQLGQGGMYGTITNGTYGSSTSNTTTYYYFFNWTIGDGVTLCESPRVEVIAEVNTTLPAAPAGDAIQSLCGADSTIGDLVVTGDNIRWYDGNGTQLSSNSLVVDGGVYYATQTVDACEGDALEVTVELLDKSDLPMGDRNQTFNQGETLADLDIIGDDLLWYADLDKMIPLPDSTPLVDQTTYYVTQTQVDACESDLKPVTVHRFLGVDDETFRNVSVLPIPTKDKLTISNNGPIESVALYNLLGQRVLVKEAGFQNETVLDVSFLSSGTYLLNVIIDGKVGTFKVIKE